MKNEKVRGSILEFNAKTLLKARRQLYILNRQLSFPPFQFLYTIYPIPPKTR